MLLSSSVSCILISTAMSLVCSVIITCLVFLSTFHKVDPWPMMAPS